MPVGTLLSPGCDTCFTCDDPPPPECNAFFACEEVQYWDIAINGLVDGGFFPSCDCNIINTTWRIGRRPLGIGGLAFIRDPDNPDTVILTPVVGYTVTPDILHCGSRWTVQGGMRCDNNGNLSFVINLGFTGFGRSGPIWISETPIVDCCEPFQSSTTFTSGETLSPCAIADFLTATITPICEPIDCAANCCNGLKAGMPNITSANKWSVGVAGGTPCFPLAIPWITTLTESPACTFQSTYAVGGSPCFTDGAGGNWFVLQMKLVVTSTNSAGPKPCTTATFTITYERVSDGTLADQIYTYAYDYCTYTTGALSLASTSHTFPSGAPVFPSVTVTALA